jgi:hypothetical protein
MVNLPERVIFDVDQKNYSNQIKDIVKNGDFTLIGTQTAHDKGFFLAPYFIYIMIPFYALTNLHPSGSLLFLLFVNVLFLAMASTVLQKMFDLRFSILFILFWSINFVMIEYDAIPWWVLLGINLGLFINMHFQFIFILFFNFFFGEVNANAIKSQTDWITVLSNFMQPYTIIKFDVLTLLLYAVVSVMFFYLMRQVKKGFVKDFYTASLILWVMVPLFFIYYGQRPSEYYYIFLLPFFLIALISFFIKVRFIANNYDSKTFAVSFDVLLGKKPGFRYLMNYYGLTTHEVDTKNLPLIEVQIPPTEKSSVRITDDIGLIVNSKIKKNGK